MRKIQKKGDFNFVWLFAIIAGTAILFLAIYGAVRFGTTTSKVQSTELAKTLSIVTDPMQAGFASARRSVITFPKDTKLIADCVEDSAFGQIFISSMIQERPNKDFELFGEPIRVENKYIFASEEAGKKFYIFSVPVSFAFKVADVIIIDSQEYCFIGLDSYSNAEKIERELFNGLGKMAKFGISNCTDDSIRVCFGSPGCDISVIDLCSGDCEYDFEIGRVQRFQESREYVGNLLYPAIFSEGQNYLCNVRRLLYRQAILSDIYIQKTSLMSGRGCSTSFTNELRLFGTDSLGFSRNLLNQDLYQLYQHGKGLKDLEERGQCMVWS